MATVAGHGSSRMPGMIGAGAIETPASLRRVEAACPECGGTGLRYIVGDAYGGPCPIACAHETLRYPDMAKKVFMLQLCFAIPVASVALIVVALLI